MVFFTVFFTRGENSEEMVFFTVFFTENTQFQLSLNKVPFSTCKKFPHEIIFPCLKCFLFVIHLHLSWTLASPRKLGQQRSTWGANGSLRKKTFHGSEKWFHSGNTFTVEKSNITGLTSRKLSSRVEIRDELRRWLFFAAHAFWNGLEIVRIVDKLSKVPSQEFTYLQKNHKIFY